MSYTPPSGDEAFLKFGPTDYGAPAGDEAKLTWKPPGYPARGFASTQFGIPSIPLVAASISDTQFGTPVCTYTQSGTATGFSSTQFGTPTHQANRTESATGFQGTQFGIPATPLIATGLSTTQFGTPINVTSFGASGWSETQFGTPQVKPIAFGWQATRLGIPSIPSMPLVATGFQSAAFGTPEGHNHFNAATIGQVTKWNYPYVAYVAHPLLLDADGFVAAKVGFPQRISLPFQPENIFVSAKGFKATTFSTPAAVPATVAQASGSTNTAFGTPTRPQFFGTTGFSTPALFGQATSSFSARAAGFKVKSFAAPTNRRSQPAASTYRAVRWGMPVAERSNTFKTYGINRSGRFGQPRSTQRFNHPATGMCNTLHGAHTYFDMRHATMIPPTQQFGKPLLKRTPTC